jgi:hypothetical protein
MPAMSKREAVSTKFLMKMIYRKLPKTATPPVTKPGIGELDVDDLAQEYETTTIGASI